MSWNSQKLDLVWIVKTWISAPSMSRLSRLTVVLPTARRTLARGKHWNFWVSSPSSATTPAIPPSVAFKDLGNTCTLWLESTDFGWNRIKVSRAVVNGAHLWWKRSKVWVVEQTKTQRSRPSIPLQGFPAKRVQREGVMIARKQKFCQACSLTSYR